MESPAIANLDINQFHEAVADHGTFCGGGSVAAVTAAGAASLVLLVLGLAEKRKVNADHRDDIRLAIQSTEEDRRMFHASADDDARVLDELLKAQAELKSSETRHRYQAALLDAALAPIETAERCLQLLQTTEAQMRRATRFTVSDLGAAGSLAFGALQASIMMADINLALLLKEPDISMEDVRQQFDRSAGLVDQGRQVAEAIDAYTRSMIRGKE